jgi:hypothetical protein
LLPPAATLAIVGVLLAFVIRTTATFAPQFFVNLPVALTSQTLLLLSSLAVLFFFVAFYREWTQPESGALRTATMMAAIGASGVVLVYLKGIIVTLDIEISPFIDRNIIHTRNWPEIVPLLSSLLTIVFLITLNQSLTGTALRGLKRATRLAILGSSVICCILLLGVAGLIFKGDFDFLRSFHNYVAVALVPVVLFAVLTHVYFFSQVLRIATRSGRPQLGERQKIR